MVGYSHYVVYVMVEKTIWLKWLYYRNIHNARVICRVWPSIVLFLYMLKENWEEKKSLYTELLHWPMCGCCGLNRIHSHIILLNNLKSHIVTKFFFCYVEKNRWSVTEMLLQYNIKVVEGDVAKLSCERSVERFLCEYSFCYFILPIVERH